MNTKRLSYRIAALMVSLIFAFIAVTLVSSSIAAGSPAADSTLPGPANLDGSTFTVNKTEATPGDTLHFTVVLSNSADMDEFTTMTNTLPTELALLSDTLTSILHKPAFEFELSESNGTIRWDGILGDHGAAEVAYQAQLTDSLTAGTIVTNSLTFTNAGTLFTRLVTTTIVSSSAGNLLSGFIPFMMSAVPAPTLNPIPRPDAQNHWIVSWVDTSGANVTYQLQEDSDWLFNSPRLIDAGTTTSATITNNASANNHYCYRVRALSSLTASNWSNVWCTRGNYMDLFNDDSTNWNIRREDTDDIENYIRYQDSHLVLEIDGRWDYAIASPLAQAPELPFRIRTRVRLEEVDNLNSYGIIWGADWNGGICPNADFTSCFNHYYRLNMIWYGAGNKLRTQLKRIDYHDDDNNAGRGETLKNFTDINVGNPADGYKEWWVDYHEDGTIDISVNGDLVISVVDDSFVDDPYFGVFASSNEYLGAEPWFDWYAVEALPDE